MYILAPLTSSKKDVHFKPKQNTLKLLKKIKVKLFTEPLFYDLIDEKLQTCTCLRTLVPQLQH
jgi:hypothetical protein